MLRQQPLGLVDMRRAEEFGYDVGRYAILMTQLQDLIDQTVVIHNDATTTEFDKRSPNQQLEQDAAQNARSRATVSANPSRFGRPRPSATSAGPSRP